MATNGRGAANNDTVRACAHAQEQEHNARVKELFLKQRSLSKLLTEKLETRDHLCQTLTSERDQLLKRLADLGVTVDPRVRDWLVAPSVGRSR